MALSYHVGGFPSRGWKKEKEHQEKKEHVRGKIRHESERDKQIREINEHSRTENAKMVQRDRHQRRHEGKKGTTLQERQEMVSKMSKD